MTSTLRRFYDALNREESIIAAALGDDSYGITLRSAINELDWYYYNLSQTPKPNDEQREQFYLLQLGACRLIHLALTARPSFDCPTVMFRRTADISIPTLETVGGLGMIQHGRRVAQSVALDLATIEQIEERRFVLTLRDAVQDDEYFERTVTDHYNSESRKRFASLIRSKKGQQMEAAVESKLDDLVFPFADHFMGYGADPLLDEFFFALAYHEVQLEEGYDTFHYSIRFGGVRYQCYILAVTFLIATALRHERFAEALIRKHPSIRLENILTISADTASFVEALQDAVNVFGSDSEDFEEISFDNAWTLVNTLSCRRGNTTLVEAPGSPIPLLVQSSEQGLIKCLTGAHSEPIRFLLESLRYHFPNECDVHQQSRETSFQRAVERVLNDAIKELQYRRNTRARIDKTVLTDVDLAILDHRTGLVVLCQLKHQEPYGGNLHSKRIRSDRLKAQVTEWLRAVDQWTAAIGEAGLRSALRLPSDFPVRCVYRLVIARHFAHPLRRVALADDTIFATWPQFFNAIQVVAQGDDSPGMLNVIELLRRHQHPVEWPTHLTEPQSTWTINELSFVVRQAESSHSS